MFEFFFNYSARVFERGNFVFTSDWPVSLLLTSFIALALIIGGFLIWYRKGLKFWHLFSLYILQLAMLALVLCIVWQPSLIIEQLRVNDNVIALMLDTSESMLYGDKDTSRMQQAKAALSDSAIEKLESNYTLQRFLFSRNAEEVDSFASLPAPASETAVADSVLEVLRQARTSALGALVVVSDGADNSGVIDPDQLAEIASYGVPVHTIGIGRQQIPEDLELQEVILPDRALPGTTLSARLGIRHDGEGTARIKVYDGEKFITSKEVLLQDKTTLSTVWVDFPLTDPGFRDLKFTLDPILDETNTTNNVRTSVVEVPEDSYRILYIEGEPRWEYKFLRRALDKDPSVQLVTLLRVSTNKFYRQGIASPEELEDGFPSDKTTLFAFDALIIGSTEAPMFTPEQQLMIHDFVSERGGSLLMLAGLNGLGDGGWGNSLIKEVLPAKLPDTESSFVREKVSVVLTAQGRRAAMLKLDEDLIENDRLWRSLPEIADYQNIGSLKPAATSLLNASINGRQQPLFVTQPYGRGQSYILATGGTWRWQMSLPLEDQRHETFWRQLARELVVNSPDRIELSTRTIGEKVSIRAEVRDEAYEPLNDVAVTAVVSSDSGESMTIELSPSAEQAGVLQGEFTPAESGTVYIEAISRKGDEVIDSSHLVLKHESGSAESFSYRMNRDLLERLAEATGGKFWTNNELDQLPDAIRYSGGGITEQIIHPLWDAPIVFLLLLCLKAIEWLLRRRWSVI